RPECDPRVRCRTAGHRPVTPVPDHHATRRRAVHDRLRKVTGCAAEARAPFQGVPRMTQFPRATAVLALAVAMSLGLSACNQGDADKAAEPAGEEAAATDGAVKIDGLPTEKEQVSYMIGRDVARSLEEVKDELDTKVLLDALESGLAGKDSLMTEEQVNQVREACAQRIQAERIAEMMAAAKKNKEAGDAFLAANKDKDGVETTESGLQYQVITQGDGPRPTADDMVRVHYK